MANYETLLIDEPAPGVQRVTLNRPDKRNAINNALRAELLDALQQADGNDAVKLSVVRGAGKCFSSGYDLKSDLGADQPYFTPNTGLQWAKHASQGWMSIWDLAKPVIAQVHGYAMAGGLELVGACDLAYASSSARLSHPVLRVAGLPDFAWFPAMMSPRHAMELHVGGREYSGDDAERVGMINQAFPDDELESRVLDIAKRIAEVPPGVVSINKRFVYTAMEMRASRAIVRTAADLQNGPHLPSGLSAADIKAHVAAANKAQGQS
jgi:enoyl-CoA hydratase